MLRDLELEYSKIGIGCSCAALVGARYLPVWPIVRAALGALGLYTLSQSIRPPRPVDPTPTLERLKPIFGDRLWENAVDHRDGGDTNWDEWLGGDGDGESYRIGCYGGMAPPLQEFTLNVYRGSRDNGCAYVAFQARRGGWEDGSARVLVLLAQLPRKRWESIPGSEWRISVIERPRMTQGPFESQQLSEPVLKQLGQLISQGYGEYEPYFVELQWVYRGLQTYLTRIIEGGYEGTFVEGEVGSLDSLGETDWGWKTDDQTFVIRCYNQEGRPLLMRVPRDDARVQIFDGEEEVTATYRPGEWNLEADARLLFLPKGLNGLTLIPPSGRATKAARA